MAVLHVLIVLNDKIIMLIIILMKDYLKPTCMRCTQMTGVGEEGGG